MTSTGAPFLAERTCPVCKATFLMLPIAPPYVTCAYCTRPPERSVTSSTKQINLPIEIKHDDEENPPRLHRRDHG